MRFTVTWSTRAVDQLALLWTDARDQKAVADAADEIDRLLRTSPEQVGTEFGSDRLLTVDPLMVVFWVRPQDRLVQVQKVGRCR